MKEKILEILRKCNYPDGERDDDEMCADEILALFKYEEKHQTIPYFKMKLIKMIEKYSPR